MARYRKRVQYDKLTQRDNIFITATTPRKWKTIVKIDADSVPAAYVHGVSISVMDNTSSNDNVTYMWYASYDDGITFDNDRVIAHVAVAAGGGNGYLKINRKIWRKDSGEVGGPITIWTECSDNLDSTTIITTVHCLRARSIAP